MVHAGGQWAACKGGFGGEREEDAVAVVPLRDDWSQGHGRGNADGA